MTFFFALISFDGGGLFTIANPTSALFKEPTSFVPSPVIMVVFPSLFNLATIAVF